MQESESDAPSKSRRKREMLRLQELGEELLTFPDAMLRAMGLPEPLREALAAARRITAHGGRRRQIQYIGKLMRGIDIAPVQAALAARRQQESLHTRDFHRLEELREALIADREAALAGALEAFPAADPKTLRRLASQARSERDHHQPPRAARALFRYLRELQDAAG